MQWRRKVVCIARQPVEVNVDFPCSQTRPWLLNHRRCCSHTSSTKRSVEQETNAFPELTVLGGMYVKSCATRTEIRDQDKGRTPRGSFQVDRLFNGRTIKCQGPRGLCIASSHSCCSWEKQAYRGAAISLKASAVAWKELKI